MAINSDISPENNKDITEMIHLVQGRPIVFDYDLANLYEMETKELNRLASKNSDYFPADFRFRLTKGEYKTLFPDSKGSLSPFAYTEQGITMFSMILKNPDSVASSLNIVRSFVEMRNFFFSIQKLHLSVFALYNYAILHFKLYIKSDKINRAYILTFRTYIDIFGNE